MNNLTICKVAVALLLIVTITAGRVHAFKCEKPQNFRQIKFNEEKKEEDKVLNFFRNLACDIQKGFSKISDGASKVGDHIKNSGKELGEKAREMVSKVRSKFNDFKERLSQSSSEEFSVPERNSLKESVEIINPDILIAEQQCGHGHILDALGNCSKLRK